MPTRLTRTITPRRSVLRSHVRLLAASVLAAACAGSGAESLAQQAGAVSIVTVLPGSAMLAIGDSVQLEAVLIGPRGDTLSGGAVQWRSANTAIARVSGTGWVHAVGQGLAGITAVSGARTGTARIVVTPPGTPQQRVAASQPAPAPAATPPPQRTRQQQAGGAGTTGGAPVRVPTSDQAVARRAAGGAHPNEPEGFRPLADRAFLTKASRDNDRGDKGCRGGSECWDGSEFRFRKFEIIEDRTAPFSCCTVARMRYEAGHRSGTAPATVQTLTFRPPVTQLYVSIWARISPNWFGNQSGTNKMFFLGASGGNNQFFLSAEGRGNGPLIPQLRLQGIEDPRARILPNRAGGTVLRRGQWQHWEFLLACNSSPNASDGRIDFWLDGVHTTSVADVNWTQTKYPTRPCNFPIFHWSPTYGGGGAPPPAEQFLDFDHVYVSGR